MTLRVRSLVALSVVLAVFACAPHPPASPGANIGSSRSELSADGETSPDRDGVSGRSNAASTDGTQPGETLEPEEAAEPAAPAPPPPLPEGTVVLHVGSSTAGALGLELKKELQARGVKCILRAKESTFIPEWAGDKMGLRQLIAQYKPDLVIVSLGGNEVEINDPTRRIKPIKRLVEALGDRPCIWVGTPRWKRLRHSGLMEVIRDNSAPCQFVDSDELIPNMQTLRDGVHPTMPERSRWAKRMIQWLEVNRDPNGDRPWAFKSELVIPAEPPPEETPTEAP